MLNEVVVDRGPCAYLCNVDLFIENRYITSVQGDGMYPEGNMGNSTCTYINTSGDKREHRYMCAVRHVVFSLN